MFCLYFVFAFQEAFRAVQVTLVERQIRNSSFPCLGVDFVVPFFCMGYDFPYVPIHEIACKQEGIGKLYPFVDVTLLLMWVLNSKQMLTLFLFLSSPIILLWFRKYLMSELREIDQKKKGSFYTLTKILENSKFESKPYEIECMDTVMLILFFHIFRCGYCFVTCHLFLRYTLRNSVGSVDEYLRWHNCTT